MKKEDYDAFLDDLIARLGSEEDAGTEKEDAGAEKELPGEGAGSSEGQPPDEPKEVELDDRARKLLKEIRKFAAWSRGRGEKQLAEAKQAFEDSYPGHENSVEEAAQQGQEDAALRDKAKSLAVRWGHKARDLDKLRERARLTGLPLYLLEKDITWGLSAFERRTQEEARKKSGQPLSNVKPRGKTPRSKTAFLKSELVARRGPTKTPEDLHPNDVRALNPASRWKVLIDETGSEFGPDAEESSDRRKGRFVALVVPDEQAVLHPLPDRWHAVECTDNAEIDKVFQAVMDAEIGVLGISVSSLPVTPGERWMDGVAMLVDWLVRLLPLDGRTEIEVLVENRGVFQRGQNWDLVARESLRKLALAFPRRAALVDLTISVIGKDGSKLNGYVDAVAFTWARTSKSSSARLRQSGLLESCLLESTARDLLHTWDAFAQGIQLTSTAWWELLSSPAVQKSSSLIATILDLIGEECSSNKQKWGRYLDEIRARMATGVVDIAKLSTAVDWLQRFQPEESTTPPLLRLSWMTVKLARANHHGEIEGQWMSELQQLGSQLIDEAAGLVCHADLHLAVAFTNRFDFANARRALEKWSEYPPAVPGLRRWGQLQSSKGQHAAFEGRTAEALSLFDKALEAFMRLSDPADREGQIAQTSAYRAIALMDGDSADPAEVRAAVELVTGPLDVALKNYASRIDARERYIHHLALRWLVQGGDQELRDLYLLGRDSWGAGQGHPWPLIQLYRGILLAPHDLEAAIKCAIDGAERACSEGQGPTVSLIGACCRAVAHRWGHAWPEQDQLLQQLESELPLAADRIKGVVTWLQGDEEPSTLLTSTLPFNFR